MAERTRRLARLALPAMIIALAAGCSQPADEDGDPRGGETPPQQTASPSQAGPIAAIAEAHGEAVVNISTTRRAGPRLSGPAEPFQDGPFGESFERFFGGGKEPPRQKASLGSGFVVSSDGYVVTNAHVVAGASEIVVRLSDRRRLSAELVGKDKATDLALLRVEANGLPTVTFAANGELEVGEWVVAVGAPFGFANSVTAGIVSAKGRSLPRDPGSYVPFLQTDVAINPGNSGGPLFNLDGEVVGVNAQIYSKSGGYMGLSFAIPAAVAQDVIAQLKADGEVRHGWLGVAIQEVDRDLARSLGVDKPRGGIITRVEPDSPAAEAGLRTGDVILAVDGQEVAKASDLPPLVGSRKPGETLVLTLMRDGERLTREVTLGALSERS
jgi:serine protease Do